MSRRGERVRGRFLVGCLLLPLLAASFQARSEEYRYLERTGEKEKSFAWALEDGAEPRLTARSPGESHLTVVDGSLATRRWELNAPAEGTALRAWREGNFLTVEGTLRGKSVRETWPLDGAPWYQALSLSLRPLARGEREETAFWMLRPDTLEPVRMEADRLGDVSVELPAGKAAAVRIRVVPTGIARLFWKGDYWFSPAGIFLRYEGPSGPPGAPKTVVVLTAP